MNFAEKVRIISVVLNSDRIRQSAPNGIDITGLTQQIAIYENINSAYLTGSITIFDDHEMYEKLDMSGAETITFSFRADKAFEVGSPIITKTFSITSISAEKTNDNNELMYCELIERHGYVDGLINFSKSYTDIGENIIEKILQDKLDLKLIKNHIQSAQTKFRYIAPYISPLEACAMIVKKITTPNGLPFFLYSTLFSNDLVLADLETIITTEPFNNNKPFVFSQAENAASDPISQMYNINTFASHTNEDTLMLAQLGGVSSELNHINATTYDNYNTRVDVPALIERLASQDVLSRDQRTSLVDQYFIPKEDDTKTLSEYNSTHFNSLEMDTYRGVNNYSQSLTKQMSSLKVVRHGVLSHLVKNTYTITGPGMLFTNGNMLTTVGNQVKVDILKNRMLDGRNSVQVVDVKRSGKFVMTAKRHLFDINEESHRYTIDISRITNSVRR